MTKVAVIAPRDELSSKISQPLPELNFIFHSKLSAEGTKFEFKAVRERLITRSDDGYFGQ